MQTDATYELIRQFASPVVAITSSWRGRANGMISDSAVRASISPRVPRLSVSIHKWHLSHEYIWRSGLFGLHLLHQDQFQLVHRLGFVSGRDRDKLAGLPQQRGTTGLPVLEDCYAAFELRVINTMDAGYATHFLGDVVASHPGRSGEGAILTAEHFRTHMPEAWREEWLANYQKAQEEIERNAAVRDVRWEEVRGKG